MDWIGHMSLYIVCGYPFSNSDPVVTLDAMHFYSGLNAAGSILFQIYCEDFLLPSMEGKKKLCESC